MTRTWVGPTRAVLVTLAAAGLVVGAARVPGTTTLTTPTSASPPAAGEVRPVTSATLTCPGPETEGLDAVPAVAGTSTVLAATAPAAALGKTTPSSTAGALTLTSRPAGADLTQTTTRGGLVTAPLTGATSGQVTATGSLAPGLAAVQTWQHDTGDDRALVSTPCLAPRADLWLVAGGGQSTRRERLVLANPGANPVTADVAVLGAKGQLTVSGGTDVAVPPRGRTTLLLDALVGAETTPVVHVTATGGLLTAVLEDSWVDGAVGRGADDAGPSAAPSTEQVIPVAALAGPARLRVAVTGGAEAVVQTRLLTSSGPKPLPSQGVVRVGGYRTLDIDLSAVPVGVYAVQVRADKPVVAGVMAERRRAGAQSDFAWTTSSAPVSVVAGSPVPPGVIGGVVLAATGGAAGATVTFVDTSGGVTTKQVTVGADSTAVVPLSRPGQVWVTRTAGTLRAGLTLDSTAALAAGSPGPLYTAYALWPAAVSATQVPVRDLG